MSSFTDILKKDSVQKSDTLSMKTVDKCCGCPSAVKIATYGKAYKEVSEGREVILFDGKPYYSCTRPCFEDKDKCWRHSTAKDTIVYGDLLNDGGCILQEDNVYFDKHRPKMNKKPTSKTASNNEYTIKINIKHSELIDEIKEKIESYFSTFDASFDKSDNQCDDEKESPFETSLTPAELEEVPNENDSGKELINKLMEESDSNDDSSSDSGSDSDDEVEMDSITTTSKYGERELAINRDDENKIYDPDTSDLLGKLIVVEDTRAPISDNGDDCIVGMSIEIDGTEYMKCALTNRVYDIETLQLVGMGKKKNDDWTLKKTKKK